VPAWRLWACLWVYAIRSDPKGGIEDEGRKELRGKGWMTRMVLG
jgi:hypothetical protein